MGWLAMDLPTALAWLTNEVPALRVSFGCAREQPVAPVHSDMGGSASKQVVARGRGPGRIIV